jgi:hypothetical protein
VGAETFYQLTIAQICRILNSGVFKTIIKLGLTDKFCPDNFAQTLAQIFMQCGAFDLQKAARAWGDEKHAEPISTE